MVLALILKPVAQLGFLGQYYLLLFVVLIKNVCYQIVRHPISKQKDFCYNPKKGVHPDVFVHSHDFIRHKDFTFQIFESETQDNAYVTFWRIRHINPTKWNEQNPILIQHGLLDCSMSWFLHQEKEKSLPYVLAEQGYDVWVGNNRGTVFSDRNSHLPNYWDFNIDHFAKYDQPALINKVLEETGKSKLIYIGHSQGSTQFLLGQGENKELQGKVEKFFGMGTVISFQNLGYHGLLETLSKYYLVEILQKLGFKAILRIPRWMNIRCGVLVHHYQLYANKVLDFISSLCGKSQKNNLDAKRLEIIISHQPGGTSVHCVKQWVQAYRYGKFRKYDYGKNKNIQVYGTQISPEYTFDHLKQLPFKSHIFRGVKDAVISDKDFEIMVGYFEQSNLEVHTINDYSHLDYAWAVNAKQQIYDQIIQILRTQKPISQLYKNQSSQTSDTSFSSRNFITEFEN